MNETRIEVDDDDDDDDGDDGDKHNDERESQPRHLSSSRPIFSPIGFCSCLSTAKLDSPY